MRPRVALACALLAALAGTPAAAVPPPDPRPAILLASAAAEVAAPDPQVAGVVRIAAVGDVMMGRSIGRRILRDGPGIVFRAVRDPLAGAGIAVANLEAPITRSRDREAKRYTFRAPLAAAEALRRGGIDVVSLANNHAMDRGKAGLLETITETTGKGILTVGGGADRRAARAPAIVERNGLRVAFLGYVDDFPESTGFRTGSWAAGPDRPGVAIARVKTIRADVTRARAEADLVVVLIHAGIEYAPSPTAEQRAYAQAALDAGASLVIGHHPHVLQGGDRRGARYVAWSLGNFVFDRMSGAAETAILVVDLDADGVRSVRWIPARLDPAGLPVLR